MTETNTGRVRKANVFVERLLLNNFRGVQELDLRLEPGLTLLVGRNNAGKSRILRALHIAVGRVPVERDDLTMGSKSPATIDVVIAPRPTAGSVSTSSGSEADGLDETFDDAVTQRLGVSVAPIVNRERFAWRTTITATSEGTGARRAARVMTHTNESKEWHADETAPFLNRDQRSIFYAELVSTQRDLDSELRRPGSAIRRILNDLDVEEDARAALECQLTALGTAIASRSTTLQELLGSLNSLHRYLDVLGKARVDAVPHRLEELARTVAVSFDTGQEQLPTRLQGSGVRSLGSLQAQNVFYRHRLGSDGPDLRPHTVTLIEEPETHLHPHAVYELPALLERQERQVVATTHSPQLATVINPRALRLIRESSGGQHTVLDFGPVREEKEETPRTRRPVFFEREMEKLKRLAERPLGDLLFAKAIVIGDGATERAFLPPVLREALGPMAHGISVIDSNGMNPDIVGAVIKFARHVDLPLQVLADRDSAGHKSVSRIVDDGKLDNDHEVIWVSRATEGHRIGDGGPSAALERMVIDFDLEVCRRACRSIGLNAPRDKSDVFHLLKRNKGSLGGFLAGELVAAYPYNTDVQWPEPLKELVQRLHNRLGTDGGGRGQ